MKHKSILLCYFLFFTLASVAFESGNIVGYTMRELGHGENVFSLPRQVGFADKVTVDDLLSMGSDALLVGDKLLSISPGGDECWVTVIEEGGVLFAVDEYDIDGGEYTLPIIGGLPIVKVRRSCSRTTQMTLAGEFDVDMPLRVPMQVHDLPISKIKIDEESAKMLADKDFNLVLKNGHRVHVKVGNARLIVNADNGRVIEEDLGMIKGFEVTRKADTREIDAREDVERMTRAVALSSRKISRSQELTDALLGMAWDNDHKTYSTLKWLVIAAGASLAGKVGEWVLSMLLRLLKLAMPILCVARGCILRRKRSRREEKLRSECIAHNAKAHFAQ